MCLVAKRPLLHIFFTDKETDARLPKVTQSLTWEPGSQVCMTPSSLPVLTHHTASRTFTSAQMLDFPEPVPGLGWLKAEKVPLAAFSWAPPHHQHIPRSPGTDKGRRLSPWLPSTPSEFCSSLAGRDDSPPCLPGGWQSSGCCFCLLPG